MLSRRTMIITKKQGYHYDSKKLPIILGVLIRPSKRNNDQEKKRNLMTRKDVYTIEVEKCTIAKSCLEMTYFNKHIH